MISQENLKSKLNLFTLNFNTSKCEEDYNQQSYPIIKKVNFNLSGFSILFSLGLLIWTIFIFDGVNNDSDNLHLKIGKIKSQDVETFQNLTTVYYDRFIFIKNDNNSRTNSNSIDDEFVTKFSNEQIIQLQDLDKINLVSIENNYAILLRKYIFTREALPLILSLCFLNFILFLLTIFSSKFHKILFSAFFFLFGLNFHLLAGILRSFLSFSSDSILCLVVLQLFLKLIIITKTKFKWLLIIMVSFFTVISEWTMMYLFHFNIAQTLTYYLITNHLIHLLTIIICYFSEFNSKLNFLLVRQLKFEREYLSNLIFNMEEGFFTYNKGTISLMNRSMQKIVENYEKILNLNVEEEGSNCNLYSLNSQGNIQSISNLFRNFKEDILNTDSNKVRKGSRIIIEKLFENLTDLNMDLPKEITDLFNSCRDKKENSGGNVEILNLESQFKYNFNSSDSDFCLEKFTEKIKEYLFDFNSKKSNSNEFINFANHGSFPEKGFANFIHLGTLEIENLNSFWSDFNPASRNERIKTASVKKFQLSFRLIDHEEDRGLYLEMMLNDVSKATQLERERTVDNCRALYLSKVAHEMKNPLSSLVELQEDIKDTLSIEKNPIKEPESKSILSRVNCLADHSKLICRVMDMFLKDFYVFANLKESCPSECNFAIKCYECNQLKVCANCSVCINCEESKFTFFNFCELLSSCLENFRQLSVFENKNIKFEYYKIKIDSVPNSCRNKQNSHIKLPGVELKNKNKPRQFTQVFNINNLSIKKKFNKLIESDREISHENQENQKNYFIKINNIKDGASRKCMIKTDREILQSVIFNLIFHSYKNTFSGEIKITSEIVSKNSVKFCFYDTGLEVDPQFIKSLSSNSQKLLLENNLNNYISYNNSAIPSKNPNFFRKDNSMHMKSENNLVNLDNLAFPSKHISQLNYKKISKRDLGHLTGDKFNKYFGIFIAHNLVKKLGSTMKIESNPLGNKYSFTLNFNSENQCDFNIPNQIKSLNPKVPSPARKRNSVEVKQENLVIDIDLSASKQTVVNYSPLLFKKFNLEDFNNFQLGYSENSQTSSNRGANDSKFIPSKKSPVRRKSSILKSLLFAFSSQKNLNQPALPNMDNPKKILLVDDEKLVRGTLKRYFKQITQELHPFEIVEAENALKALDLMNESFLRKSLFDVIITDEYMPFMKGSFFIKIVRQIYNDSNFLSKRIQIVSYTAFDSPEIKASLRENGADFIWNKPIAYEEFRNHFENIVK